MDSWQEAQLHALSTAETEEDIAVALSRAARDLGQRPAYNARHFRILGVDDAGDFEC